MKTDKNYIAKEYQKLYKRIMNQMKESNNKKDSDFLWKHLIELQTVRVKYENYFQTYIEY